MSSTLLIGVLSLARAMWVYLLPIIRGDFSPLRQGVEYGKATHLSTCLGLCVSLITTAVSNTAL